MTTNLGKYLFSNLKNYCLATVPPKTFSRVVISYFMHKEELNKFINLLIAYNINGLFIPQIKMYLSKRMVAFLVSFSVWALAILFPFLKVTK